MHKQGVIRVGQTPPRQESDETIGDLDRTVEKEAAERVEARRSENDKK